MERKANLRVIVGIDDSIAGLRALRTAVAEARRRNAALHAIRVWTINPSGRGAQPSWYYERERAAGAMVAAAFTDTMGGLPADLDVLMATLAGTPGRALTGYADRDDDLLVVGHSPRGPLGRLVRASVSRYCGAHASCPVLVVPPDRFARQARREGMGRAIRRDLPQFTA